MEIVFWLSVALIIYPYVIYPPLIYLLGWIRSRPVKSQTWSPLVTVLIPAYNEASCIGATVQNKLVQNYPQEKIQIIVISDSSTDGTDDIVRQFDNRRVQLLRREGREGKAAGLNDAIQHAVGEVVVFSDANSLFQPDAIRYLVENLADPDVGYVTGNLDFVSDGSNIIESGVGIYNRYENFLRLAETRLGSIIGVNGGVGAIRRDLYSDTPPHLITDFVLPLSVIAGGNRVVFDPRVISHEAANTELNSEFRMRVRVTLRALQGLAHMRRLLNPFRYPLIAFCIGSHKVLRYLGFIFMIVALACNIWLAQRGPLYQVLLAIHLACYLLALVGLSAKLPGSLRSISAGPSYLAMSNAAFAFALFKFLRGDTMATWKPRAG